MPKPSTALAKPETRGGRHKPPADISPALKASLEKLDELLDQPPIPGPKPWSDELERAAVARVAFASPPLVALASLGVPHSTAQGWLSEEDPPREYQSACRALVVRLKSAYAWCESDLLERIRTASLDPKHWTAAAWILERSRGYVVKQQQDSGPAIVVNIGTVNIAEGRPRPVLEAPVVDAEVIRQALPEPENVAVLHGSDSK